LFFEHKKLYRLPRLREELPEEDYIVEIGKARDRRVKAKIYQSSRSARRF
jgi:pyruvate/2-oxoglutarate/acetoin dehydrogenase E1 component